ncbi:MAG: stalk domain-containing protein [Tepidanaerobacteraceae bacterium]|jgi:hypothetical protein
MQTNHNKSLKCLSLLIVGILLFFICFNILVPVSVLAAIDSLEISGDGVSQPITLTLKELEKMEHHQEVYSSINTWPTKKWYVGRGVKLWDILVKAGIKEKEARLIRFTAADGYIVTLTMKELFEDERYRFPNFMSGGSESEGHIPGDPSDPVPVEPIIALVSVEGSDNPKYMNELNCPMMMLGQRAVTEQTGNLFVKNLHKIEVLTEEPEKWDPPQANPPPGTVPKGTMVTLSNLNSDDDKIYYTTDGSTPTLNSPMYNWIASRWWAARADVLGKINHPIGPINSDTTIKTITIGPGKLDSDVVTFNYRIADSQDRPSQKVIIFTVGKTQATVDGSPYTLDAAPYIDSKSNRTLVPIRFISEALKAQVDWDPKSREVKIVDVGKEIVLTIGSSKVVVNGVQQDIDCEPAILPPGRTFVPIRFVSETLEANVHHNNENGQITISR